MGMNSAVDLASVGRVFGFVAVGDQLWITTAGGEAVVLQR
jgi:hypothetical protein